MLEAGGTSDLITSQVTETSLVTHTVPTALFWLHKSWGNHVEEPLLAFNIPPRSPAQDACHRHFLGQAGGHNLSPFSSPQLAKSHRSTYRV